MSLFTNNRLNEEGHRYEMHRIIEKILSDKILRKDQKEIDAYFEGHFPRFREGLNLAHANIQLGIDSLVLEYGSPIPYFSFPFFAEYNVKLYVKTFKHFTLVKSVRIWLQRSRKYMTEVWEHLPCSLLEVKAKILKALKTGVYKLCSFPVKAKL
jgi:hypothetical protein